MSSYTSPSPLSNNNSCGPASTTTAELVAAEAQYLSNLKRVGNALSLSTNLVLTQGRKVSNTIRGLMERWTALIHFHVKFHDDIRAVKEDTPTVVTLLINLLFTLEPVLMEHGREISNVVYKLTRDEKKAGHNPVEWEGALRHPFDHLMIYNEWIQRIDAQPQYKREGLAQLNEIALNVRSAIESNQNPRNMLKRISTLARNVIRRPTNAQWNNSAHSNANDVSSASGMPISPTSAASAFPTPDTATTLASLAEFQSIPYKDNSSNSSTINLNPRRASIDTLRIATAMTTPKNRAVEAFVDQYQISAYLDTKTAFESDRSSMNLSGTIRTWGSPDSGVSGVGIEPRVQPVRSPKRASKISSIGSMQSYSSSESLNTKTKIGAAVNENKRTIANVATTTTTKPSTLTRSARFGYTFGVETLTSSQHPLPVQKEIEPSRVIVRLGTQSIIAASKTERLQQQQSTHDTRPLPKDSWRLQQVRLRKEKEGRLQLQRDQEIKERKSRLVKKTASGRFVSRPSIERLRAISTNRDPGAKPPVKSLISFWERTAQPIEV
ncbi:hypothetical protein BX616_004030 [Lobosporangium transversale]|uniref:DH domain-containing protein n=1 Tax=Lobosporangium transversale TaxID=64571 RepID=A0A1Y2GB89_9FUNG|nr:hypothetical protein BCR41DRAFT_425833 [Lobosporangium transversale]KAF9916330.1 hypothetical protein BX616_004030 [Lobosporangium transversale]ORZ04726.1 hypothetical protein BCR41DRAFT_425833 [Lobosporangium transversale]|eukprot:XP_021876723.1 hypothetical protein BCR41DRAFT_425833 [Lobosporangium transversale]